jgi:hypothetical protein
MTYAHNLSYGNLYSLAAVSVSTYVRAAKSDSQYHSTCLPGSELEFPNVCSLAVDRKDSGKRSIWYTPATDASTSLNKRVVRSGEK